MPDSTPSPTTRLPALAYLLMLAIVATVSALRPANKWDLLGYMAAVESLKTSDAAVIHRNVFSAINVPHSAELLGNVPNHPDVFRSRLANESFPFAEQVLFYSIKPLYIIVAAGLHRFGLPLPEAMLLIAVASYLTVGWTAWVWLARYFDGWRQMILASLLMVDPPIIRVSRYATPDAMMLAMAALGLYLLMERSQKIGGSALLLSSIWVRPDAVIVVGLLFCALLISRKIDVVEWLTFCMLALFSHAAIQIFGGPYSWDILFYNSFVSALVAPGEATLKVSPHLYWHILLSNGSRLLTWFGPVLFIGGIAVYLHRRRLYRNVTGAVLVAACIRFIIYPNPENRFAVLPLFFIPLSLFIALCTPEAHSANCPHPGQSGKRVGEKGQLTSVGDRPHAVWNR